jgi:hypothetical protein
VSLRAAVRARIGHRQQRTFHVWRAGLAAAAVVAALVVGRAIFDVLDDVPSSRPGTLVERNVVRPPSARPPDAASSAVPEGTATGPRRVTTTDRVAVLRPPPPVVMVPIDVRPLEEPPLQVERSELPMPLRAEYLEIDPLVFQ